MNRSYGRHYSRIGGLALADLGCTLCCLWGVTALACRPFFSAEAALSVVLASFLFTVFTVGWRAKLSLILGLPALASVGSHEFKIGGLLLFFYTFPVLALERMPPYSDWVKSTFLRAQIAAVPALLGSILKAYRPFNVPGSDYLLDLAPVAAIVLYTVIGIDLLMVDSRPKTTDRDCWNPQL